MPWKALLHELQQLKEVSGRLELLADEPAVTGAISQSAECHSTAKILEMLAATKLDDVQPI